MFQASSIPQRSLNLRNCTFLKPWTARIIGAPVPPVVAGPLSYTHRSLAIKADPLIATATPSSYLIPEKEPKLHTIFNF